MRYLTSLLLFSAMALHSDTVYSIWLQSNETAVDIKQLWSPSNQIKMEKGRKLEGWKNFMC